MTAWRLELFRPDEEGFTTLLAPDGTTLRVKHVPGRGWRCSFAGQAGEDVVPLYASLQAALSDCLGGVAENDPWVLAVVRRLAPEEGPR